MAQEQPRRAHRSFDFSGATPEGLAKALLRRKLERESRKAAKDEREAEATESEPASA